MNANEETYTITCSIILTAKNKTTANKIITEWINQLIVNEDIIHGEIEGIRSSDLFNEPDEPLYNFKGFDNYPGHPL